MKPLERRIKVHASSRFYVKALSVVLLAAGLTACSKQGVGNANGGSTAGANANSGNAAGGNATGGAKSEESPANRNEGPSTDAARGGGSNPVEELFRLCKEGRNEEAAAFIGNGDIERSRRKDFAADYSNPQDREVVDDTCERAKAAKQECAGGYEVGTPEVKTEGELQGYLYPVTCNRGDNKKETSTFIFVKQNDRYILIDVD